MNHNHNTTRTNASQMEEQKFFHFQSFGYYVFHVSTEYSIIEFVYLYQFILPLNIVLIMRQLFFFHIISVVAVLASWCFITSNAFTTTTTTARTTARTTRTYNFNNRYSETRSRFTRIPSRNINNIKLNLSSSSSSSSSKSTSLPDVADMKASELRKELQSYGISTKSFFEKSELVDAVEKARSEGKTPIETGDSGSDSDSGSEASSQSSSSSSSSASGSSRSEKLAQEMEKCNKMKVLELRKELESYGISTKSFFEKSEFVRAAAEARVDGVKAAGAGGRRKTASASREEEYDPSYRDVTMQKMDPRLLGMSGVSSVIDVRLG